MANTWEPCTVGTETWRCRTIGAYEAQFRSEPGRAMVYRVIETPTSAVLLHGTASGVTEGRLMHVLDAVLDVISARRTSEISPVE